MKGVPRNAACSVVSVERLYNHSHPYFNSNSLAFTYTDSSPSSIHYSLFLTPILSTGTCTSTSHTLTPGPYPYPHSHPLPCWALAPSFNTRRR